MDEGAHFLGLDKHATPYVEHGKLPTLHKPFNLPTRNAEHVGHLLDAEKGGNRSVYRLLHMTSDALNRQGCRFRLAELMHSMLVL